MVDHTGYGDWEPVIEQSDIPEGVEPLIVLYSEQSATGLFVRETKEMEASELEHMVFGPTGANIIAIKRPLPDTPVEDEPPRSAISFGSGLKTHVADALLYTSGPRQTVAERPVTRHSIMSGEVVEKTRTQTIQECVAWLALHCWDYKPEAMAHEMATEMLGDMPE